MTKLADVTLARSNRQALDLLRCARRFLDLLDGADADAVSYLLDRVDETLGAGIEQYERGRRTIDGRRVIPLCD